MDSYIISITIIGLAAFSAAWIPSLLNKVKMSYSIFYLLLGFMFYSLPLELPWPNPIWEEGVAVRLTELVIIVALMGSGLKIDHAFSFRKWRNPFRLISITMLISIGCMAFIAWWLLGFDPASAILLGAVLAPTDPVLAADVQVGPPMEGKNDEVRFSLTAEAGMNDGMAFPFTWLAIAAAMYYNTSEDWISTWIWKDLLYRTLAGLGAGYLLGKGIAYLFFRLPKNGSDSTPKEGFVAISSTLFVYGITELIHGYGFLAVFVAAVVIRNYEMQHEYHKTLHSFTDQTEKILMIILLLLFGGSLSIGILDSLSWKMAWIGIGFVLLLRPLAGFLGLVGTGLELKKKSAISFFGIKGIGSFFYLSFALKHADFNYTEELWAFVSFIVLFSIIVHGLTANVGMKWLGLREAKKKG